MANRVQKLTVNVAVETTIKQALIDLDNLSKKLSSLSLPKTMTAQLEKDIQSYGSLLSKALDFTPNTNNLGSYDKLIQKIDQSYKDLSASADTFSTSAKTAFSSTAELDKYRKSLENIQATINELIASSKTAELKTIGVSDASLTGTADKQQRNVDYKTIRDTYGKESEQAKELIKHISTLTAMRTKEQTAIARVATEEARLNSENQQNIATTTQVVTGIKSQTAAQNELDVSMQQYIAEAQKLNQIQSAQQFEGQIKRWTAFAVAIRFAKQQFSQIIDTYRDLDKSLTQIAVVSGRTRDQMWGMIETYNEMAQRLGTTTQAVVESSKLYFQQGRTQSEVMKLVEQTTILATISELDFATATDYLTAAINGFKLSADEAINVTDVWANLAAKAAVDANELAVAISKVASLAASAGMEIESTSAFLTKMIETTREAPENLGTALKTIIARFQELKLDPMEELEDGVDANKVEKALKTAEVALRDLNGEFRDFDDVILELSSKWDGLSRNQQRYIATQAAGARQQSRFIALVEDYQRNLELIDIANTSAGASTVQFGTQLTGLQESLNRLQSAWEGLYTSWSQTSGLISTLVDLFATFVSSLADAGLGFTIIAAALGFFTIKLVANSVAIAANAAATEGSTKGMLKNTVAIALETLGLKAHSSALDADTAKQIANNTAKLASLGIIGLVIIAVVALIAVIAAVVTARERELKAIQERIDLAKEEQARAQQEIHTLDSLIKKVDEARKANEDLASVKQDIIDQFPDLEARLQAEGTSYQRINEILKEHIRLKEQERAIGAVDEANALREQATKQNQDYILALAARISAEEDYQRRREEFGDLLTETSPMLSTKVKDTGKIAEEIIDNWDGTFTVDGVIKEEWELETGYYIPETGQWFDNSNDFIAAMREIVENIRAAGNLNTTQASYVAVNLVGKLGIEDPDGLQQSILSQIFEGMDSSDFEEGLPKEEIEKWAVSIGQNIENALGSVSKDVKESFMNLLQGNYEGMSVEDASSVLEQIYPFLSAEARPEFQALFDDFREMIKANMAFLGELGIEPPSNIAADYLDKIVKDFENAAGNEEYSEALRRTYKKLMGNAAPGYEDTEAFSIIDGMNPTDINQVDKAIIELADSIGTLNPTYQDLLTISIELGDGLTLVERRLRAAGKAVNEFNSAASDGKSYDEMLTMIYESDGALSILDYRYNALSDTWELSTEKAEELTRATVAAAEAQNLAAIEAEYQAIAEYAAAQGIDAATVAAQIAALQMAILGAAEATAAFQAGTLSQAEYDLSMESYRLAAAAAAGALGLEALADAEGGAEFNVDEWTARVQGMIASIGAFAGAVPKATGGAGGAAKKAADATDEYTKALKANADALKDVAEAEEKATKARIDAIKAVLEAKKEELEKKNEKLQKEIDDEREAQEIQLEAWQRYLDERLEDYQKHLDDMEKAADDARKKADDDNARLKENNEVAQKYYKDQIALIQDQINAINNQAAAEDRLQKLREAQDAYERAKNSRTRVVLTRGGGWTFRRDQDEIESAQTNLRNAQNAVTIADLEAQKEELQAQADAWAEQAENIGKTTEELKRFNDAYANFTNMSEDDRKLAYQTFAQEVIANNSLNQNATDLQKQFEDQSDDSVEGTIAWNIKKTEELKEKIADMINTIGMSYEEFLKESQIKEALGGLQTAWDGKGPTEFAVGVDAAGKEVDKFTELLVKNGSQIEKNEKQIEKIDKTIENYDKLLKDLGKSTSELNQEQALFNEYYDKTIKQLEKGSKVWKQTAADVKEVAEYWERANAAQKEYEAAKAAADSSSSSVVTAYARGGINDYTGLAMLHGTKAQPEVVLNNSQAGKLFKFIDGLASLPVREQPTNKYQEVGKTIVDQSVDQSTNFENCDFNVTTDANNVDALARDLKRFGPLRR